MKQIIVIGIIILLNIVFISKKFISKKFISKKGDKPIKKEINQQNLIDDKLFEREIRNATIEAVKEFDLNPDSVYIPHKNTNLNEGEL